jgi:FkbM family methyltransferase
VRFLMGKKNDRFRLHGGNLWKALTNTGDQRRAVLRRYVFDATRQVTPGVIAESDGHRFLVSTRDKELGRSTFSEGTYELNVMRGALKSLASEIGHDPVAGRVFVDVGANVGTTTAPAVTQFGASRVLAIEPSPENFAFLRCNAILNGIEDRVTCVQVAVSTTTGTLTLELSDINLGDNRVRAAVQPGDYREERWATITVPAAPLDAIITDADVDPSTIGLVWVDTQGHEGQVLASAPTLLARRIPFVIEYWPYGLRRSDGLGLLHSIISDSFSTVVDARRGERLPAGTVAALADYYTGRSYTDLLLVP